MTTTMRRLTDLLFACATLAGHARLYWLRRRFVDLALDLAPWDADRR